MDTCKPSVEDRHAKGKTNMHAESPKRQPLVGKNKKIDVKLVKGD